MPPNWLDVPHFKQEHHYSCLAAAVRMVLAYYGRTFSEEELRALLDTTPHGTTARIVLRVKSLGFDLQLASFDFSQIEAALAAGNPPILFVATAFLGYWKMSCDHVVVVVGRDETTVFLNDPFFDDHPQSLPLAELLKAWAAEGHVAAIIRPGPPDAGR
jgi:ABC-type bacteriocin/lantibiotic exporter with double-glycine peptidase domain